MPYKSNIPIRKYTPQHPEKYKGDASNIFSRSQLELKLMKWADTNKQIVYWASEELAIPYINPLDGQWHRYFPDFIIQVKKASGLKTYIIEVKPKAFSIPPKPKKRKTKGFILEVKQYSVNLSKWEAAKKYAEKNGMEFLIITEEDLGRH